MLDKIEPPRYDREKRWIDLVEFYRKAQQNKDADIVKAAMGNIHCGGKCDKGNARRILQGVYDRILNS